MHQQPACNVAISMHAVMINHIANTKPSIITMLYNHTPLSWEEEDSTS